MKKQPLFYLLICSIVVLLSAGCCREKTSMTIGRSPEAQSFLPYIPGGTVWFVRNGSDTVKTAVTVTVDSVEVNCEGDCCERLYQASYNIFFKKQNGDSFAEIAASNNIITFNYNKNRFADLPIDKTTKLGVCDSLQGSFCYDSLVVNNRMYYKVYKLLRFYQQGDAKQLFFSKDRGILRVEYTNGDVYQTL
ncbi:MAG: hypothetical protein RI894_1244 [Bacteroidota bacterium]|jgi:hypothetical protein